MWVCVAVLLLGRRHWHWLRTINAVSAPIFKDATISRCRSRRDGALELLPEFLQSIALTFLQTFRTSQYGSAAPTGRQSRIVSTGPKARTAPTRSSRCLWGPPHCRVILSPLAALRWCWWLSNCQCSDDFSLPVLRKLYLHIVFLPQNNHFTASPYRAVETLGLRARRWCWWLSNCQCSDRSARRC